MSSDFQTLLEAFSGAETGYQGLGTMLIDILLLS